MKLSQQTISVLQNFQTLNPSIVLTPGNIIKTMTKTTVAKATVSDVFPMKVGIYDLSKFLGILSLDKESDVEFNEKHMIIKQGRSKVKYSYCETSLILHPEKDVKVFDTYVRFDLTHDTLQGVTKAMAILGFSEIEIRGEDGILSISTVNTKNNSSDVFSTEIGEVDKEFSAIIEAEKLKLIPATYTVTLSNEGLSHFRSDTVEYWIALSTKSNFK